VGDSWFYNFCLAFASLIIPETEKLVKSYKNRDTINLSFHLTWFLWVCLDINGSPFSFLSFEESRTIRELGDTNIYFISLSIH
jgi:hypothetical protein